MNNELLQFRYCYDCYNGIAEKGLEDDLHEVLVRHGWKPDTSGYGLGQRDVAYYKVVYGEEGQ